MNQELRLRTDEAKIFRTLLEELRARPSPPTFMALVAHLKQEFLPPLDEQAAIGTSAEMKAVADQNLNGREDGSSIETITRKLLWFLSRVLPAGCQVSDEVLGDRDQDLPAPRAFASDIWNAVLEQHGLSNEDHRLIVELLAHVLINNGFVVDCPTFDADRPLPREAMVELTALHLRNSRLNNSESDLRFWSENDDVLDDLLHHWGWLAEVDYSTPLTEAERSVLEPLHEPPQILRFRDKAVDLEDPIPELPTAPRKAATNGKSKRSSNSTADMDGAASNGAASNSAAPSGLPLRQHRPSDLVRTERTLDLTYAPIKSIGCENRTKTSTALAAAYEGIHNRESTPTIVPGQLLHHVWRTYEEDWRAGTLPRTVGDCSYRLSVKTRARIGSASGTLPLQLGDFDGKKFRPDKFDPEMARDSENAAAILVYIDPEALKLGDAKRAAEDAKWLAFTISELHLHRDIAAGLVVPMIDEVINPEMLRQLGRTHLLPEASDPRLIAGHGSGEAGRVRGRPMDRIRSAMIQHRGNNRTRENPESRELDRK